MDVALSPVAARGRQAPTLGPVFQATRLPVQPVYIYFQ